MNKHLATIRKGWQSKNFARYILSNFSFVSQPCTIADDIGSDFFCTIFSTIEHKKQKYLVPKNSFAIQIKSNRRPITIDGKIEYLRALNIPYFVGVIDPNNQIMDVYSGEYLIPFFVDQPEANQVKINLCRSEDCRDTAYCKQSNNFIVKFPKIVSVGTDADSPDFKASIDRLSEACITMSGNIMRRNSGDYIFADFDQRGFFFIENKTLIKESLERRLLKVRGELAYILENRKIDSEIDKYTAIRKALMKV